jgi:hypothetical protein
LEKTTTIFVCVKVDKHNERRKELDTNIFYSIYSFTNSAEAFIYKIKMYGMAQLAHIIVYIFMDEWFPPK